MAKQLLPLNSKKSMIQETVERLRPLAKAKQFWIITNDDLRAAHHSPAEEARTSSQIMAEPVGRNTAPAIGLAAFLLARRDPCAVIGMFPSDHVIADENSFRDDIRARLRLQLPGRTWCIMRIKPTRPETGYGYIEVSPVAAATRQFQVTEINVNRHPPAVQS